jgi:PAT family beta-lactamase induction signal transducer AmpG
MKLSLFKNPRIFMMLFMGFSSGLPLGLTGSTLQAWFTQAGIGVVTIGALTLIGTPYVWKFLWAPLMDRFVPPWLGRRRGWISLLQLSLCTALFLLANMNPSQSAGMMGILALAIAFLSASQDITIDAYRTDVLLADERGAGSAVYIFAYRMAMLFSGGFALIFADYFGWRITYELMAITLGLLTIATYFAPNPSDAIRPPKDFKSAIVEPFKDFMQRDGIILILLFIVFYKIGDAFALSLMSNFLLRGLHFSLTDVGLVYKTVGLFATIVGASVGGIFYSRLGMFRSLFIFGFAQAFSNLMFVLLAMYGKSYSLLIASIFIEQFCSGLTAVALLSFLMSICHQQYSATQFASLSALSAVGRVFLGPIAGVVVAHVGWVTYFTWSFILSFPGIILLSLLYTKVKFNVQVVET